MRVQGVVTVLGVTVEVRRSSGDDGAIVIDIETDPAQVSEGEKGPEVRVYLNDTDLFIGKEYEIKW